MSTPRPWDAFLRQLDQASSVTLVGPLHDRPHTPDRPTIYVDGGAQWRPAKSTWPQISVGDGDSFLNPLDETLPKEKDNSDLAFALHALPKSVSDVQLIGFLDGALDHELANLGEIHQFLLARQQSSQVTFMDATRPKITAFNQGARTFSLHGTFSVFVLESAPVRITGACRYPLNEPRTLQPLISLGLSNEGFGEVVIDCPKVCFLVRR